MHITVKDAEKVIHLARLQPANEMELNQHVNSLSTILTLAEHMNEVDTSTIKPMAHPLEAYQRLREDKVTEPNLREQYQKIAPATESGLYLVPKVIE